MKTEKATPEELIAEMSVSELQELLGDLGLESTVMAANRLRQLVQMLDSVEQAIDTVAGPSRMRRAG